MNEGFYININGSVMYAPNFVSAPDFELRKENKDQYQYPVHGWYWFDSEDLAYEFFGIEKPELKD